MKQAVIQLINLYQATLSPDHGWLKARYPYGFCRFYPSCSEYAKQAVAQRGVLAGLWLTAGRLLRCNPWVQPAVDQLPNK